MLPRGEGPTGLACTLVETLPGVPNLVGAPNLGGEVGVLPWLGLYEGEGRLEVTGGRGLLFAEANGLGLGVLLAAALGLGLGL